MSRGPCQVRKDILRSETIFGKVAERANGPQRMPPLLWITGVVDRVRELIPITRLVGHQHETCDHPLQLWVDIGLVAGDVADGNEGVGQALQQIGAPRLSPIAGPPDRSPGFRGPSPERGEQHRSVVRPEIDIACCHCVEILWSRRRRKRRAVIVRRRMIWNIRGDFGAEVIGSSGSGMLLDADGSSGGFGWSCV